jgi:5'-3' exonuclease
VWQARSEFVNKPLVYFDASWLAHRAKWTMRSIAGSGTEIIFGFLEQMRATCLGPRVRSNRVAFFFDSRHSFRRDVFPSYKAKRRNKTPQELAESALMADQLKRLRKEILPDIGFPCFRQAGLESDDLIAQACEDNPGKAIIITADEDLLQCISPEVHWYDPSREKYIDLATMIHEYRVGPADWVAVKCMAGCSTDGVPGIVGVGEKTATDFLWLLVPPGRKLSAINSPEGRVIAERNYSLINLPHPATRLVVIPEAVYNPAALFEWGEKLGFKSYLEPLRRQAWETFFAGEPEIPVRKRNKC